jgi:hypothetical protein
MTKPIWDLETPRGRILPAALAGLLPVIAGLAAAAFVFIGPMLNALERDQRVLSASAEIRSTSRALQRDILLMIFDADSREKTGGRLDARVPQFRAMAVELEQALSPVDLEKATRLRVTHEALADGFAAVIASVRSGASTADSWVVQQERVLANEIPAARSNDPVVAEYQARVAATTGNLRAMFWMVAAMSLILFGLGIATATVVLRR